MSTSEKRGKKRQRKNTAQKTEALKQYAGKT